MKWIYLDGASTSWTHPTHPGRSPFLSCRRCWWLYSCSRLHLLWLLSVASGFSPYQESGCCYLQPPASQHTFLNKHQTRRINRRINKQLHTERSRILTKGAAVDVHVAPVPKQKKSQLRSEWTLKGFKLLLHGKTVEFNSAEMSRGLQNQSTWIPPLCYLEENAKRNMKKPAIRDMWLSVVGSEHGDGLAYCCG